MEQFAVLNNINSNNILYCIAIETIDYIETVLSFNINIKTYIFIIKTSDDFDYNNEKI